MNADPKSINARLYAQLDRLLKQLEKDGQGDVVITVRDRITALIAIGRIQTMFMGLRKENKDDARAGSTVRKYAKAFKSNAASRRKTGTGPAADDNDTPDELEQIFTDTDDGDDTAA